jgi:hypothetical protein
MSVALRLKNPVRALCKRNPWGRSGPDQGRQTITIFRPPLHAWGGQIFFLRLFLRLTSRRNDKGGMPKPRPFPRQSGDWSEKTFTQDEQRQP